MNGSIDTVYPLIRGGPLLNGRAVWNIAQWLAGNIDKGSFKHINIVPLLTSNFSLIL